MQKIFEKKSENFFDDSYSFNEDWRDKEPAGKNRRVEVNFSN